MDPRKTEAVNNWPRPLAPTDIRSFLCLKGYYRWFFDGLSSISSPFTNLTQNNGKFEWLEACKRNFQLLSGQKHVKETSNY